MGRPLGESERNGLAHEITVVVRSARERTESCCLRLLSEHFAEGQVVVIKERPFHHALKKSFEAGIEGRRPWTLCIDADLLVGQRGLGLLLERAQDASDALFEIQAKVLDKLFGGQRPAGNHLYRTALLKKAMEFIPSDSVSLRPETFTIKRMAAAGHPWVQEDFAIGLHDHEQFFRDIHRKAFLHAHKHRTQLPFLEQYWKQEAPQDKDFSAALLGLSDGLKHEGRVSLDAAGFFGGSDRLCDRLGMNEKGELAADAWSGRTIDRSIETFAPSPEFLCIQQGWKTAASHAPVA